MSGFEVVVRPVVLPNIRPPQAQVLPPEDNPEQGLMVIKGSPTSIGASESWSMSMTKQKPHEEEARQSSRKRVYEKDKDGKTNKQNYIDVMSLQRVRLNTSNGPIKVLYKDPTNPDNVETLETNITQ